MEVLVAAWGVKLDAVSLMDEKNRLVATSLIRRARLHEWADRFSGTHGGLTRCARRLRDGRYETLGALYRDAWSVLKGDISGRLVAKDFKEWVSTSIKVGDLVASGEAEKRRKPGPKPRIKNQFASRGLKRRSEIKVGSHSANLASALQNSWMECCETLGGSKNSLGNLGGLLCDLDPNEETRKGAKRLYLPTEHDWLPIVHRLGREIAEDFKKNSTRAKSILTVEEFWKLTAAIERREEDVGKATATLARLAQLLLFKRLIPVDEELSALADLCSCSSSVAANNSREDDPREKRLLLCAHLLARRHLLVAYLDSKMDNRIPPEAVRQRTQSLLSVLSSDDDTTTETAAKRRRTMADFQPLTMADAGLDFIQLRLRNHGRKAKTNDDT